MKAGAGIVESARLLGASSGLERRARRAARRPPALHDAGLGDRGAPRSCRC